MRGVVTVREWFSCDHDDVQKTDPSYSLMTTLGAHQMRTRSPMRTRGQPRHYSHTSTISLSAASVSGGSAREIGSRPFFCTIP